MIEQHERYVATIRIRRGPDWSVRPECAALDGLRMEFCAGWQIGDTDRAEYASEWAMLGDIPCGWIASGDLADIEPLERRPG